MSRLVPSIHEVAPQLRDLANDKYAKILPREWPLSSGRVALAPFGADMKAVHQLATVAFDDFERASAELIAQKPEVIPQLLAGVDVDPSVRDAYIYASAPFSARRLDVLQTPEGMLVTENDEQPGGLGLAYLYDLIYGVNEERWYEVWKHLTAEGKLLFVVSDDWSASYHVEIRWLAERLRNEGHDVEFLSTASLERLAVQDQQVLIDGEIVGTVFRLFPIFETKGKLADIVRAADRGVVRLVPEFSSWGNKTWFALFGEHKDFFRQQMNEESFTLLESVLPQTVLVQNGTFSAPFTVGDIVIDNIEQLGSVTKTTRRKLLVKVTGANRQAARSYGVRIGSAFSSGAEFQRHLAMLQDEEVPFLVQSYVKGREYRLPAYSVLSGSGATEEFRCRVIVRPWSIGGMNVGLATASPVTSSMIHGTTASAFVPLG